MILIIGKLIDNTFYRESCITTDEQLHIKDLGTFTNRKL